jgi:succinate dehydrogenase / fumarate reductase cytochrome b subunit
MEATAALTLWSTSVGKKVVMAVTGALLVLFVLGHMAGNLKVFQGEEKFNAYAAWLREMGTPALGREQALWLVRLVLLGAAVLHVTAATQLTLMSRAARPVAYQRTRYLAAGYAARTMRWGGALLLLFVVYHLLHLTAGVVGYGPGQFRPASVYRNVVAGFSVWYVSAFYLVAQAALGLHLFHGVWSAFQTLGAQGAGAGAARGLAGAVAVAVAAGNASVPIAVLAGLVR